METVNQLKKKYQELAEQALTLEDKIQLGRQFREELEQINYVPKGRPVEEFEREKQEFEQVVAASERLINSVKGAVLYGGIEYKFGEWVTITDYCRIYSKTPSTVMNWIARGIVPKSDIVVIPELNDLKLLRNTDFKQAS